MHTNYNLDKRLPRGGGYEEKGWKMACNWVVMRSSHCPYLVRIESNADFLSRFYGWLENQPHPDCVTTMSSLTGFMQAHHIMIWKKAPFWDIDWKLTYSLGLSRLSISFSVKEYCYFTLLGLWVSLTNYWNPCMFPSVEKHHESLESNTHSNPGFFIWSPRDYLLGQCIA